MKVLSLICAAAALALSTSGWAQPDATRIHTQRTVARHLSHFGTQSPKSQVRSLAAYKADLAAEGRFAVQAAPVLTADEPVLHDTMLVTSDTYTYNGKLVGERTYTYNDLGHQTGMVYRDLRNNTTTTYRMQYQYNAQNYWTSYEVQRQVSDDQWVPIDKRERVIDGQHLLSEKYYVNKPTNDGVYLSYVAEYEYSHTVLDSLTGQPYDGVQTKSISYNPQGDTVQARIVEWCDPLNQYIETYLLDFTNYDGHKVVSHLTPDSITTRSYKSSVDEPYLFTLTAERSRYLGPHKIGEVSIEYYSDGTVSDATGLYSELHPDSPEAGQTEVFTYSISYDAYEPQLEDYIIFENMKIIAPSEFNLIYGKDFMLKEYTYVQSDIPGNGDGRPVIAGTRAVDPSMKPYDEYHGKWIGHNLYEVNGTNYEGDSPIDFHGHLYYRGEYADPGFVVMNPDGSYVVLTEEPQDPEGSDWAYIYTYYNAQHQVTRRLMMSDAPIDNLALVYHVGISQQRYYEWQHQQWVPVILRQFDKPEWFSEVPYSPVRYTYDEQGRILTEEWFSSNDIIINDSSVPTEKAVCTYEGNNQVHAVWYNYVNGQWQPSRELGYRYTAPDDYEESRIHYYDDGTIYGHKAVHKDGFCYDYDYDVATQQFQLVNTSCENLVTIDPATGVTTTIRRYMDGDSIINYGKTDSYNDGITSWQTEYAWVLETQTWLPVSKDVYILTDPLPNGIRFFEPSINDIYSTSPQFQGWQGPDDQVEESLNMAGHEQYEWDSTQGDFVLVSGYKTHLEQHADTLVWKGISTSPDYQHVRTITAVEHPLHGVVYYKEESTVTDHGQLVAYPTHEARLTYNAEDLLVRYEIYTYEGGQSVATQSKVYDYTYAPAQVRPTQVDELTSAEVSVTVSGRTISVAPDATVQLYTLQGQCVATGTGSVTAPVAGSYIVRTQGHSYKVHLR